MRLPWPFNRTLGAAAAPADNTDVFNARPTGPQAWRDLPVLQRSVGDPPLIAPTPPFRDELAGAAPAPIALAPLSHGRGLEAPAGIARNVAKAVAAVSGREPPTLRRRPSAPESTELDAPPEAPVAEQVAPVASPTPTVASTSLTPTAQPKVTQRASMVSAQRQASLPALPVGRIGAARAVPTAVQRAPAKPSVADEKPVPAAPAGQTPAATPAHPSAMGTERLTLGQSRRLGLGAPIEPTVARSSQPLASSDSAVPGRPVSPEHEMPVAGSPAKAEPEQLPVSPIAAPKSATEPPAPTLASTARPLSGPGQVMAAPIHQRAARSTRVESKASTPLVGARSMATPVQRAPLIPPVPSASPPASPTQPADLRSGPEPVRIHRGARTEEMAGALDARAFTHGGEIYLPDKHGPLSGQKAQSLLAHEMTHVAQQRKMGSSLPDESTSHGQRLEAEAAAAETHEMPLAMSSSPQTMPAGDAPSTATSAAPTRQLAISTPVAETNPQRAPSANDAKFTDPDDAFRDKLRSNEDELFAIFERRLRHQLIHERERGGTLIDAL